MPKPKKLRVAVPKIQSTDGLGAAVNDLVERQTKLARKRAKLDEEIAKLNTQYDEETAHEVAVCDALFAEVHLYCDTHREVFGDQRSAQIRNASFGFRTCPPKVEKAVSKDSWEAIARRLQSVEWGAPFLTIPEPAINKETLISERANLDDAMLAAVGIRITQAEKFFVDAANESAAPISAPNP
jgi:phage host-nuclease inhibitor protein Gam